MTLNDFLRYDPITGKLFWRERAGNKAFNGKLAGKEAGVKSFRRGGAPVFIAIGVGGRKRTAHRVIWEMHYGPTPNGMAIDHVNGDPFDNRLDNLRTCDTKQNLSNRGATKASSTGLKGVYLTTNKKRYEAKIKVNYRPIFIGTFDTKGMAALAYAKASLRLHGKFSVFYRKAA